MFTVPGTITLRDTIRVPANEHPIDRLYRLACKAGIEGCQVFRTHADDALFAVTSGSTSGLVYAVDVNRERCDCEGWARHGVCKHLALALAELGELPDPNPPAEYGAGVAPRIAA